MYYKSVNIKIVGGGICLFNKKLITIFLCILMITSNLVFSQTIVKASNVTAIGWTQSGGTWRYLNSSGKMVTGWVKDGGIWYYLKTNGVMATGWLQTGSTWYYLRSNGAMGTGWIKDGATWYYLNSSGDMAKGWIKDGGTWYYLNPNGAMKVGWTQTGGTWYYLYSSGGMALNVEIDGYNLGSDGAMENKISLNKYADRLIVGGADTLIASVPLATIDKSVTWTSSNSNIVAVDNAGRITAIGLGTATITAITAVGNYKATCNVLVSAKAKLTFAIDIGHNSRYDTGAVGIRAEDITNKEVGTRVMAKLINLGYNVVDCSPTNATSLTNSLQQRCDAANAANADYYVAIHFNMYNGAASGSEVFIGSDRIRTKAQQVLNNIVSLGYIDRGILDNSRGLYVLSYTNMPAMLIECSFLDSVSDMNRYDADAFADAIVNGLIADN